MKVRRNKGSMNMVKYRTRITNLFGIDIPYTNVISGVYIIDNLYVGSSVDIPHAVNNILFDAVRGVSANKSLQQAIRSLLLTDRRINIRILSDKVEDKGTIIEKLRGKGWNTLLNKGIR